MRTPSRLSPYLSPKLPPHGVACQRGRGGGWLARALDGIADFDLFGHADGDVAREPAEAPPAPAATARKSTTDDEEAIKEPTPILVPLSSVTPRLISWLWRPYIATGKLTILEGDPGVGKSWVTLDLAARLSRGRPLPGDDEDVTHEPRAVLLLSAEDSLEDTIRPRLDELGGDAARVICLQGKKTPKERHKELPVTLADILVIEKAIVDSDAALVIVDPIQAYLGAKVDLHRANEVRPVLHALAALAERRGVAVLAIRHLSKSTDGPALYRGLGSIDLTAAARSVLIAGWCDGQRVLAQSKSSAAAIGPSLGFSIDDGALEWKGEVDVTANEVAESSGEAPPPGSTESGGTEGNGKLDAAKAFVSSALAEDPMSASELKRAAKEEGIKEATLKRAKSALNVRNERVSFKGGRRGKGTWWCMLPWEHKSTLVDGRRIIPWHWIDGRPRKEEAAGTKDGANVKDAAVAKDVGDARDAGDAKDGDQPDGAGAERPEGSA